MKHPESKVVLITGASSGLGAATARACARAGHRVALAARREDRLLVLAEEIGRPDAVLVLPTDMRRLDEIRRMVAETTARFGRIDALVANAGVGFGEPLVESTEEHLLAQVEVNVLGVVRCAREVLPAMLARRSGHILTVSSVAAHVPTAGSVLYAATKGAVTAFSEALRREVGPQGVHVTTIAPGFIESEMTANAGLKMPPASLIGDAVVRLLRRPRARAVIPRYYGVAIWAERLAPGLMDHAIAYAQARMKRGG
jgi:NADP-dependent 3-hydroxy acid dehydrogenase YdfG